MGTFNPAIMDKVKWREKTVSAMREDIDRKEGIIVGYAICYFDPFAEDTDKQWAYTIRLAHSQEYLDEEQKMRLEKTLHYIMCGVQKIIDVDKEELEKMASGEDELSQYCKQVKFNQ